MEKDILSIFRLTIIALMTLNIQSQIILSKDDELSLPLPMPYNGKVLSFGEVEQFLDASLIKNKQPILIFGANWCPDCRIFSGTIEIPKIREYIDKHYNLLYIDVKRYDINMDLMENYGIPAEEGIPRVLVFNHHKKLINNTTTAEWRTARERSPQDIFNFFQNMER